MRKLASTLILLTLTTTGFAKQIRIWDDGAAKYVSKATGFSDEVEVKYLSLTLNGDKFTVQECMAYSSKIHKAKSLDGDLGAICVSIYEDENFNAAKFSSDVCELSDTDLGIRPLHGLVRGVQATLMGAGTAGLGVLTVLAATGGVTAPVAPFLGVATAAAGAGTYKLGKQSHEYLTTQRRVDRNNADEILNSIKADPTPRKSLVVQDYKSFADSFRMLLSKLD